MKPTAIIALIVALAFSFSMTSCVEDIGEIDRTQANVLKKTDFRGAWYKLGVVTDMPASSGYGFVGYSNFAGKVIFDIQEQVLIVYPFSEKVKDSDSKWHKRKIRNYWDEDKADQFIEVVVGNPIGMYPITSHFDIQREYSTTTGKQGNVLKENTTDQVWYKRKYMRVDWMGNTHADPFGFGGGGAPFELKVTSADHYVQEHETDDPNRFHMQDGYFDYTKRFHGMPQSSGWCSTYSLAPGDCSGSTFEVRFSFKRVAPNDINDFEIRDYHDNPDGDRFGYFLASRYTYDEDFGLTYAGHDYKAQIWNLWQDSKTFEHASDKDGKMIPCQSNFDCAKPLVCDQKQLFGPGHCAHGKRIEYSQRGLRPVLYHLSAGHPISHLPAAYKVADNWSAVFKDTVSWLYFWEAKWAKDDIKGFDKGHSNFGQRYCESNADCAGHALGNFDAKHNGNANSLFIATKDKTKPVWAVDDLEKRADWMKKWKEAKLKADGGTPYNTCKSYQDCEDGWSCLAKEEGSSVKQCKPTASLDGRALIMLVNASVGDAGVSMTLAGKKFGPAKFASGIVDAHAQMHLIEKADAGRQTVTVTAGGSKYSIQNANIEANRVHFVIFYGGDSVAVVRSTQPAKGVRVFHGAATGTAGKVSSGPLAEAGVNGVRGRDDLVYGDASDFLYYTGATAGAVLVAKGSRTDVNCADIQGVSQCIGWRQHLTEEDRGERLKIRASLPAAFALCTNVWSGDNCGADKGNPKALNDCRYWTKDKDGKEMNPCKKFVPEYNKAKIIGDIRYNYIYWVTNPHSSSPLGYGPSGSDPDTGQLVWGTAYIYGAPLTTYGQYGKDLVDLVNGDLSVDDLVSGKYIRQFLQSQSKTAHDKGTPGAAHFGHDHSDRASLPTSAEEAAKRATADISEWSKPVPQSDMEKMHEHEHELMKLQDPKELSKFLLKEFPTFDAASATARLKKIEGTAYEAAMINDEMALVMSNGQVQPGDALPPEMIGKISPLGWATPQPQVDDRYRMMRLGMENIYSASFIDTALVGLAKRLKCKDGQKPTDKLKGGADNIGPEACYKGGALLLALQTAIFRGVLEHEIGHTVGLRHNFSASADVLNYFEPYYGVREKEPVYCRSYSSPFGVITANDMCETILGEVCVPMTCASDAECPDDYACGTVDGTARCLDSKKNVLGSCHGDVDTPIKCDSDALCGAGGLCKGANKDTKTLGVCFEKVTCTQPEDCNDGETCKAGVCIHGVTGAFRSFQKFDSANQQLKKYMPRPAPTQNEIEKRRTEYQYSSIMDYGQKINADFEGLGKYDYAAIRYGYGRLQDIFADTSHMRRQIDRVVKNSSSTHLSASWRMGTSGWEFAGAFRHPFEYLNNWMPPEYLSKRDSVPSFFVDAEAENATKYGRSHHDRTMFQVPYKYCSDEYRGGSLGCYYFDTGAHMQEIVYHAAEQMREYYVFDAFKRERMWYGVGGNPSAYMSRLLSRYLLPIGAAARYYAVYNNIMRVYSYFTFLDQHPMYMKALREASEASFRELSTMLSSPAPGAFKLSADGKRYVNVSFEKGASGGGDNLNIPLGVGKLPWTTFSTKAGYYYADHPAWIGSYWDKVAAIMTMTSSSASFLSDFVGEQLPIFRGTAIGFNTIYPKELSTILGGLAAGATDEIGMLVDDTDKENKKLLMRDPFKPSDVSRPRVEPSIMNLSLRLYAAWQAIANLPAGFDPSYTDSMAVWLKGSGVSHEFGCEEVTNPDGTECNIIVQYAEFQDPFGHKTYVAPKVNYNVNYFSPTFYMLTQLNKLKQQWEQADGAEKAKIASKMKQELEIVDYFRLLYKTYGSIGL